MYDFDEDSVSAGAGLVSDEQVIFDIAVEYFRSLDERPRDRDAAYLADSIWNALFYVEAEHEG